MIKIKEKRSYAVFIALIMLLNIIVPIVSFADVDSVQEPFTIHGSVNHENNTYNLRITDSNAAIDIVKIFKGTEEKEASYFIDDHHNLIENRGEDLDYTVETGSEGRTINISYELEDDVDWYTVFIMDEERATLTLPIGNSNDNTIEITDVSQNNPDDKKELTITVNDTAKNIALLKIQKVNSRDEVVDFDTQGTLIGSNYNTTSVVETYTVAADGIYKIYAENEDGDPFVYSYIVISQEPVNITATQDTDEKNKLEVGVTDKLFTITKVEIIKYNPDVTEQDWSNPTVFNSEDVNGDFTSFYYTMPSSGKYLIRATEEIPTGIPRTITHRTGRIVIDDEDKQSVEANIDRSNPDTVNITAHDPVYDIEGVYVYSGDANLDKESVKRNAEEAGPLNITPGNDVTTTCPVGEGESLYVYIIGRDGQGFIMEYPYDAIPRVGEDPGTTDPGTTDPGTTDPGTTDPGTTDPGTTDPGTTDPGTTDPGTTDPGTTDPGTTDPGTTDPGTTDPGTTDPGTTDPGTTDPGTTDPGTTDPGTTDPGTTDPGTTDPGTTDPGTTDPGTTDPGTTDPGTTDPGTTAPGTTDKTSTTKETKTPTTTTTTKTTSQATKTEAKDGTRSNTALPKTGLGFGVIVAIFALIINSIVICARYRKIK